VKGSSKTQVSSVLRIVRGERDALVRTTHFKAAVENVSTATIERKKMSTKTSFKRVALVAVAAMGFGMLSVVSASATSNTNIHCLTADGLTGGTLADTTCSGVAGAYNTVTLNIAAATAGSIITSTTAMTNGSADATELIIATGGLSARYVTGAGTATFTVATPTVGTITVSYFLNTGGVVAATAAETVVITVNATAQSGVLSVADSLSFLVAGESSTAISVDGPAADAVVTASADAAANTEAATIKIKLLDALGAAVNDTLTATITSGPGTLSNVADTSSQQQTVTSVNTEVANLHFFYVYGSGKSGTTVITIKDGTTVVSTETVTFFSTTAVSLAATMGRTYKAKSTAEAGATNTSFDFKVLVKDADGNPITGATPTITSADTTKVVSGTCTATVAADTTHVVGTSYCNVTTGATVGDVVLTIKASNPTTVTTTVTVTVVSNAVTVLTITGPATAIAGDKIKYTVTATDAAGRPVADGTAVTANLVASATANGGVTTTPVTLAETAAGDLLGWTFGGTVAGVSSVTLNGPLNGSALSVVFTLPTSTILSTALDASTVTVATTVTSSSDDALAAAQDANEAAVYAGEAADAATVAAEEATAAATAAQESADAATAAVVALGLDVAKLINDLRAQITALTSIIVKIQKKVKA